ncbi:tol-pal system-associated acyl-CoA thioesterase [Terasakiella brassicae]|uniref:Tol-pal system-associated acyl-CoA thioesterase n=1 Tax=Terasakiella brassicae TaxID=1634917 RepID=A0A917BSS0_9PROT|nr:tol-pal system-associated acyl-CoA thioesterase [Terasakiella brassicae]GGF54611.1 tol-pal system-associated acyl-CoA thioesterase [Terasakiella brassicae]
MTVGRLEGDTFIFPIRVYYEDTDAGEIVYYANYLKFAERARTEFLRYFNIHQSELLEKDRIAFAVRRAEADYRKPAKLDDLLEVHTRLVKLGGASLEMEQVLKRDGETLVCVKVRIACIHLEGRAVPIPKTIRQVFMKMLGVHNGK